MKKKVIVAIVILLAFVGVLFSNSLNTTTTIVNKENYLADNYSGLNANTIYIKDNFTGKYIANPGSYTVDANADFELVAILEGPLNMNGDVPSTENYVGSGFWSWEATFTNEWTQLDSSRWLAKVKIHANDPGTFNVGLGKNGNGMVGSITLNVVNNYISVDNLVVGTQSYNGVNKNSATRMFNGVNSGNNTDANRYPMYIGDKITVSAEVPEGYTFSLFSTDSLAVVEDTTFKNNKVTATFKGLNPGYNHIALNDTNGNVVETFYVIVRYPIYVNTELGEIFKDYIHEYLDDALYDFYIANTDAVVTNPYNVPQYVKNGLNYYRYYYLFGDSKVELVTYLDVNDTRDFELEGNLEMTNHKEEIVEAGDKAGLKRISAEFHVTVADNGGLVRIGWDEFVIAQKSDTERVHHFDLETKDRGRATVIETRIIDDTKVEIETSYSASITDMHEGNVYSSSDKLVTIAKHEFWQTFPEEHTQYESTSAYLTNEEGKLVDDNGVVIEDAYRQGLAIPTLKQRNVLLNDIDKVEFKVNLLLDPIKKVTRVYKKDENGDFVLDSTEEESVTGGEQITYEDYTLTMSKKQIVDAYNKCPFHSGLDFTVQVVLEEASSTTAVTSVITIPDTLKNVSIGLFGVFVIALIVAGVALIIYNNKKDKNE
jgi:hypothetical protein